MVFLELQRKTHQMHTAVNVLGLGDRSVGAGGRAGQTVSLTSMRAGSDI